MKKIRRNITAWLKIKIVPRFKITESNSVQLLFLNVMMVLGSLASVIFCFIAFFQLRMMIRTFTAVLSCAYFIFLWIILRKHRGFEFVSRCLLLGFLISCWFSNSQDFNEAAGQYFPFAFPLVAFFLSRRREGIFWVLLFFSGEIIVHLLNVLGYINNNISSLVSGIRLMNLAVVAVVSYFISLRQDKMVKAYYSQAYFDSITKLPNRSSLIRDLNDDTAALFILSLDDFKELNALFGYRFGDKLLSHISDILRTTAIDLDLFIYRLSGSEFAIRIQKGKKITVPVLEYIAEILLDHITKNPLDYSGKTVSLRLSIGIGYNTVQVNQLFHLADLALKQAKSSINRYLVFQDVNQTVKHYKNYLNLSNILQKGLDNDKIFPYFQPIFDNRSGELVKYESLVRVVDDLGEIHTPGEFLSTAKKLKVYPSITRLVLKKTMQVMRHDSHSFSINLSYDDFSDPFTMDLIYMMLDKNRDLASRITFEILESEGMENKELVNSFIYEVKNFGCSLAIDDFGSGYANFDYLLHLDFDFLKIDGSLIKNIHLDNKAELVVKNIIDFARNKNVETVAEYVHNDSVLQKVKEMGIHYSQGFYLGEPAPLSY